MEQSVLVSWDYGMSHSLEQLVHIVYGPVNFIRQLLTKGCPIRLVAGGGPLCPDKRFFFEAHGPLFRDREVEEIVDAQDLGEQVRLQVLVVDHEDTVRG